MNKNAGNYMKIWAVIAVILALLSLPGCQRKTYSSEITPVGSLWPTREWDTDKPESQGVDGKRLDQMSQAVIDEQIPLHSLLIIRNGVIIFEKYYSGYKPNTQHELYSVTKSVVSTLFGIALDQGKITSVDQKVLDLLGETSGDNPDPRKQAITLENLLTMTSGLDWPENDAAYRDLYMSPNWVERVLSYPMAHEPGKTFNYCSGCTHVLSAVVRKQTGGDMQAFANQYLFKPLGITDYQWEKDRQGNLIGGWGLSLTPRDMAKLGYLYLNDGIWEGKQIVSSQWVKTATQKHVSTDGDLAYGYQWWIYPTHNAYTALGRYGQTIFVAPEQNLIVVTTALLPAGHDPIFNLIDNYIFPAIQ